MLRLIGSFYRNAYVICLSLRKLRKMYAYALQVQASYLLIKMLGQAININRILLIEELNLSQRLVGETVAHNKAGVTCSATQVNQTAIGQKDYAVSVREEVTVHLRLYVLTLDTRYLLEFVNLDLTVKCPMLQTIA